MSYTDFEKQLYRREVLDLLRKDVDNEMSERLLVMELELQLFFSDQVNRRAHIAFLQDRGLVAARFIGDQMIITLLDRGRMVALGKERIEGIADKALSSG
jgi:hypothetical protein